MKKIIITVDGWSSCGKSTMARQLAKELNYVFIDSGAMYRAITLYFIQKNIDVSDNNSVLQALSNINLHFENDHYSGQNVIFLNGINVDAQIRELAIAQKVSEVAANASVRAFAVAEQQKIGELKGIVMDGRDIGTTVFPQAELKIFMTANQEVRVNRRYAELVAKNPNITIDEVRDNLAQRDYIDSHREVSPLRKADDALILDNSALTPNEQLAMALAWAQDKING